VAALGVCAIANLKRFLLGTFHGASHRYLQDYLNEFGYRFRNYRRGNQALRRSQPLPCGRSFNMASSKTMKRLW
jgi:hypothetical protein